MGKIFILAETQELWLLSPIPQEHFYCHQERFRHPPKLQSARAGRNVSYSRNSSHWDSLLPTHSQKTRIWSGKCPAQEQLLSPLPARTVTSAQPVPTIHLKWLHQHCHPSASVCSVTDTEWQKSKGDSVLVTYAKADYVIPKLWDWRSSTAYPRATEDAVMLKHEGDHVLLCQPEGQIFHMIHAICLPHQGVLKKPVKEYVMRLQAAKPVWVNAWIPCRVSFSLCIRRVLSEECSIPLFRQQMFNDENPCTARGDPPSRLVWILSSPVFWCFSIMSEMFQLAQYCKNLENITKIFPPDLHTQFGSD